MCGRHRPAHCMLAYTPRPPAATAADGTHPTGMHYCFQFKLLQRFLPDASNDLQLPSGANIPSFWNCNVVEGFRHRLQPPTTAASQVPVLIDCSAWSNASSDDEHAVSMAKLGPVETVK